MVREKECWLTQANEELKRKNLSGNKTNHCDAGSQLRAASMSHWDVVGAPVGRFLFPGWADAEGSNHPSTWR